MAQRKRSVGSPLSEGVSKASDELLTTPPALAREALALDPASITQVRLPLDIVRHNAAIGAKAVLEVRGQIKALLRRQSSPRWSAW